MTNNKSMPTADPATYIGYFIEDTFNDLEVYTDGAWSLQFEQDGQCHAIVYTDEPDFDTWIQAALRFGLVTPVPDDDEV